ncbi:hypothetical protein D3C78_943190 [compost metagenome]
MIRTFRKYRYAIQLKIEARSRLILLPDKTYGAKSCTYRLRGYRRMVATQQFSCKGVQMSLTQTSAPPKLWLIYYNSSFNEVNPLLQLNLLLPFMNVCAKKQCALPALLGLDLYTYRQACLRRGNPVLLHIHVSNSRVRPAN